MCCFFLFPVINIIWLNLQRRLQSFTSEAFGNLSFPLPKIHLIIFAFRICSKAVFYLDQTYRPDTFFSFKTLAVSLLFLNVKLLLYLDRSLEKTRRRTCDFMCWSVPDPTCRDEGQRASPARGDGGAWLAQPRRRAWPLGRAALTSGFVLSISIMHIAFLLLLTDENYWFFFFWVMLCLNITDLKKGKTKSMSWSVQ